MTGHHFAYKTIAIACLAVHHACMMSMIPPARPLVLPVILAGGVGRRLAPYSTDACPKPFLPLSEDGSCLYGRTLARLHPAWHAPLVIGRAADRFALLNRARELGCKPAAILLEDAPHNTGMAVAYAAAWAARYQPQATLLILPADHLIAPTQAWQEAAMHCVQATLAHEQPCVLIAPATEADAAFGYVLAGPPVSGVAPVVHFVEKPEDPAAYIARGYGWNMGQCAVGSGSLAALLQVWAPAYALAAHQALAQAQLTYEFTVLPPLLRPLAAAPFDRLVLERAACCAVPFSGHWSDLGTVERWARQAPLPPLAPEAARIDRPWGYFRVLKQERHHTIKQLTIYPKLRLSLQMHQYRAERWRVLAGIAHIQCGESKHILEKNEEISIPSGVWHRLENKQTENLIIYEEQLGECSESDIVRAQDDYGRI